ncbi:ATP-binding protein [Pseudonocardia sp. UM4_GMWB1]|uniref:ATP-binding protein n=1 Tax=Pseudonocardia sp. UM4_GMWB1 TaxID=2212989 RepID=UPI00307F272C
MADWIMGWRSSSIRSSSPSPLQDGSTFPRVSPEPPPLPPAAQVKSAGVVFDGCHANPTLDPATVDTLTTGAWIKSGEPLCLIGDSETGKSHLLIALGAAATHQGIQVRYTLATKLLNELLEAADERQMEKTIARYGRGDLLCVDELGYMELDRLGAELLFQVLTEGEETNAIAIASNQPLSGWTRTFTDPRLCAAIHRPPNLHRKHHRDRHPVLPTRLRPDAAD